MYLIVIFIVAYLLGAINPAILLSKKVLGTDIRDLGSGNAGTTNIFRVMGLPMAILVFVLDLVKVVLAYGVSILLCKIFSQNITETLSTFAVGVLIGHCYPAYYGFKGGKGVATMIMALLLIDYKIAGICITAGIVLLLVTQTVSKASIGGAILLPILMLFLHPEFFLVSLFISLFIIFKHRANIKRIIDGTESKTFGNKD
ncbi:MAG: glycerol-3-phosphate 1-O-acyltransferase PlsY [Clostridia bacterium]